MYYIIPKFIQKCSKILFWAEEQTDNYFEVKTSFRWTPLSVVLRFETSHTFAQWLAFEPLF